MKADAKVADRQRLKQLKTQADGRSDAGLFSLRVGALTRSSNNPVPERVTSSLLECPSQVRSYPNNRHRAAMRQVQRRAMMTKVRCSKHWLIRVVREAGLSIRFDEHVAANITQRLLNPSLRVIGGSLIEIR